MVMARHKQFDKEEVLAKAMTTFWRYGYEGTSMQTLVQNMGINRGSLYDTFGDKRALFLAAIAHYENTVMKEMVAILEAPGASKTAIVELFENLIDRAIKDRECFGCLITNTAIELCPHDADTAKRIATNLQRVEQAFKKALKTAQKKGEISLDCNLDGMAQYLTVSLQGLRVISKVNRQPELLRNVVEVILSTLT